MMGIPPSECKELSLWEYSALLYGWNKAHDPDGDLPSVSSEVMERKIDALFKNPDLLKGKPKKAPAQ